MGEPGNLIFDDKYELKGTICRELVFSNDRAFADVPKLLTAEFKHR